MLLVHPASRLTTGLFKVPGKVIANVPAGPEAKDLRDKRSVLVPEPPAEFALIPYFLNQSTEIFFPDFFIDCHFNGIAPLTSLDIITFAAR